MSKFTENFLKIIAIKGLTRADVWRDLGIRESTQRGWVKGHEPSVDVAKKIADYLNISLDELVGETKVNYDEEKFDIRLAFLESMNRMLFETGVKKKQMCKETGIPESTTRGWTRGQMPSLENAKKVADYFNVTIDEFISGKTNESFSLVDEEKEILLKIRNLDDSKYNLVKNFINMLEVTND